MGQNAKATDFLKECMADALIQKMQEKPFEKVTVNEIADLAGVNRSTWFRNFKTKNDALSFKIALLYCLSIKNEKVKLYVVEVKNTSKGAQVVVSRTHPGLVKRLFELEVPEIYEGVVEIKSISREAGSRSKIAVVSHDENVDPMGACVGPKGARVQNIVDELKGEKIDIIKWSKDPAEFLASALSPAKVLSVTVDEETKSAKVIVDDNQLSLAIGKEGQNVRLAAKLTNWKIDIKSKSQAEALEN